MNGHSPSPHCKSLPASPNSPTTLEGTQLLQRGTEAYRSSGPRSRLQGQHTHTVGLLLYPRAHSAHLGQAAADTDLVLSPGSSGKHSRYLGTINECRPASSPLCQVGLLGLKKRRCLSQHCRCGRPQRPASDHPEVPRMWPIHAVGQKDGHLGWCVETVILAWCTLLITALGRPKPKTVTLTCSCHEKKQRVRNHGQPMRQNLYL